jgi:hypothetical protein
MKVLEKMKVQEACERERENNEGEWARAWTNKKKKSSAFLSESLIEPNRKRTAYRSNSSK